MKSPTITPIAPIADIDGLVTVSGLIPIVAGTDAGIIHLGDFSALTADVPEGYEHIAAVAGASDKALNALGLRSAGGRLYLADATTEVVRFLTVEGSPLRVADATAVREVANRQVRGEITRINRDRRNRDRHANPDKARAEAKASGRMWEVYVVTIDDLIKVGIGAKGKGRIGTHERRGWDLIAKWETDEITAREVERHILTEWWPSVGITPGVEKYDVPRADGSKETARTDDPRVIARTVEIIDEQIGERA